MPEIKQLECPSCGASIILPPNATRGVCAYCGNPFAIEGEAALKAGQDIAGAIKANSEQTLSEIQRMQLTQQHALLMQQFTSVRMHLDSIESEIRTLQRSGRSRVIRSQERDLQVRRKEIMGQLDSLQAEMTKINVILNPEQANASSAKPAKPATSRRLSCGCLLLLIPFLFICLILTALAASSNDRTEKSPRAEQVEVVKPTFAKVEPTEVIAEPVEESGETPVATPDATSMSAVLATVKQTANVRNLPTTNGSEIRGQVKANETVELRGRNEDSSWFVISSPDGLMGWISASLLNVDPGVAAQLPVESGAEAIGE